MITDKSSCNILAEVLSAHGVRDAVVSPGSRNAPLILAFDSRKEIKLTVVADERSAAFIALGMAQASRRPVALVCTSGSALLNHAPAVAEAYYQGVPLIVVSADRPEQWIDQDDSQTIRQFEALSNFVKRSYDIPDCIMPDDEHLWFANRIANDACITAIAGKPGPVHINVQLHAPLTRPGTQLPVQRIVESVGGEAMTAFASLPNVFILHETLANLHINAGCTAVDTVVGSLDTNEKELLRPDIVITFGGALVSRFVKQYLREYPPRNGHWAVGHGNTVVDCFKSLTLRVDTSASGFFRRLGGALRSMNPESDYRDRWAFAARGAMDSHDRYLADIPWSDIKALQIVFDRLPSGINLQLSNGTPVRYAQLLQKKPPHAVFCNRGVSGIDGCTSTAAGASTAYRGLTLLISGDLSFSYDISALAFRELPSSLRIIVMNNSGGAIFRFVGTTASLPHDTRERYFCANPKLDLQKIADAFGFGHMTAENTNDMEKAMKWLLGDSDRPLILEIRTSPEDSAEALNRYFKRK